MQEKREFYVAGSERLVAKAIIPDDWQAEVKLTEDTYNGRMYPFAFNIIITAPDNKTGIMFISPAKYTDYPDMLKLEDNHTAMNIFTYELLRNMVSASDIADDMALKLTEEKSGVKFVEQRYPVEDEDYTFIETVGLTKLHAEEEALAENNITDCILEGSYYSKCIRVYEFFPQEDIKFNLAVDTYTEGIALHYTYEDEEGLKQTPSQTEWVSGETFALFSPEETFEENYKIFMDFANSFEFSSDIYDEYTRQTAEIDKKSAKAREEKNFGDFLSDGYGKYAYRNKYMIISTDYPEKPGESWERIEKK